MHPKYQYNMHCSYIKGITIMYNVASMPNYKIFIMNVKYWQKFNSENNDFM